ncbi:pyridoxamine 5'-phosphate oxidase family protein [Bacillus sp. 2205SS5-2]|uniref:pyridoxamine 5'-phosphate oxidase family protein n=1 Tax=Bacillus sp. 2205SS5-2 TaxID=3109031 RepID=UPI003006A963
MKQTQLKEKILKVIQDQQIGTLATVKNQKPYSRYMTFFHEDLTIYSPTSLNTHKVEEIEKNPFVHILLGYEGNGYDDSYVEIEGKAVISTSYELKEKFWREEFRAWFSGVDDPNYIVLKIQPSLTQLMNGEEEQPQVLET